MPNDKPNEARTFAAKVEDYIQLLLHDDRAAIATNGEYHHHGSLTRWLMFNDGSAVRMCSADVFGQMPGEAYVASKPLTEAERDEHHGWLMEAWADAYANREDTL